MLFQAILITKSSESRSNKRETQCGDIILIGYYNSSLYRRLILSTFHSKPDNNHSLIDLYIGCLKKAYRCLITYIRKTKTVIVLK